MRSLKSWGIGVVLAKTSDDYRPCVVMYPQGGIRKANVLHVRLDSLPSARDKLRRDLAAWVTYPDWEVLREEFPQCQ